MTDRVQLLGDLLQRRRDIMHRIQWVVVAFYIVLMLGPVLALLLHPHGQLFSSLARFTEAVFWGFWWPLVILSMMLFGQVWCGLLCPDGMLSETASRHGRALKPPPWLRRDGLALALFIVITFANDATDAHRSHWGTLLSVGIPSLAAVATGLVYGRGKRIWCRYLCPVSSIFSLLARCAVLHFEVDRQSWDTAPRPVPKPVDCPLLLDVRRLNSNEKCNMCARCSGHRGAVSLALRAPGSEIASLGDSDVRRWEAAGICYVLIGLGYGGAIGHGDWRLIAELTLGVGSFAALMLAIAALGRPALGFRLAYGLIPLAGLGLFLGAIEHSIALLAAEGLKVAQIAPWLRAGTLAAGAIWSGWLLLQLTVGVPALRRGFALAVSALTVGALTLLYQFAPAII
jgi:polyferredoxin